MKNKLLIVLGLFLFLTLNAFGCTNTYIPMPKDKQQRIQQLKESTVVVLTEDFNGTYLPMCSGVWITNFHILTARHCVESANIPEIPLQHVGMLVPFKIYDQETYIIGDKLNTLTNKPHFAIVTAISMEEDLALLMTVESLMPHPVVQLYTGIIPDGMNVDIIGHTIGLEYSYAPGTISATRLDTPFGQQWKMLHVVAAIGPGNSGGGVFTEAGQLIGIVSYLRTRMPLMTFSVHRDSILKFLKEENIYR